MNKTDQEHGGLEEWETSIRETLKQVNREEDMNRWGKLCIYRVPRYLQYDNKSYFPQTVSLGPYHHGKEQTKSMEYHKWRAVNKVLKRTKQDIKMYMDAMAEVEEQARACYQGPIDLKSREFVKMLVLDGCFVLELFKGTNEGFTEIGYAPNDPVFAIRGLMHSIQRDMIMLENQLPLFVLDRLLEVQLGIPSHTGTISKLAVYFFDPLNPSKVKNWMEKSWDTLGGELHCLDAFRRSLLQSSPTPNQRSHDTCRVGLVDKRQQQVIHCVKELNKLGVRFRRRETDRFWDIQFQNGLLEIPRLLIHDAFEQCHIELGNNITSYIIFMDNLINSSEDVSYLHHRGIIEHWLGSDAEVADLFNRLCQEVVFDPNNNYLSGLPDKVNDFCRDRMNALDAALRMKYANNPFTFISSCVAGTLLFLTFFQTFFTVFPYFKPSPY